MNETRKTTDPGPSRESSAGQRMSHGLVALSSAVVLAVYSAGYLRTQAAADRFTAELGQRRPVAPAPAPVDTDAASTAQAATNPATTSAPVVESPPVEAAPAADTDSGTPAKPVAKAVPAPVAMTAPAEPATPAPLAPATPQPGRPAATAPEAAVSAAALANTAPVAAVAPSAAVAPAAVSAPAVAAPSGNTAATSGSASAAATAPAPAAPQAPGYQDGTYTGWGTSRHGDIQAQVVITNGRITSTTIAQCLTRYPCSWIQMLPAQVVSRQSPETDYVSGATQSTNALYYGVVEALGKARIK